jgi:hypothetical protein
MGQTVLTFVEIFSEEQNFHHILSFGVCCARRKSNGLTLIQVELADLSII